MHDKTSGGDYRITGRGSDMAVDVAGPSPERCLALAVEAVAAAVAEVAASVDRRRAPVEVPGAAMDELLVGLIDEVILRLDADGHLAVGLADVRIEGDRLRATLELVDLGDVDVHGTAPKAATWHGARLQRVGDAGWEGHVLLDL